MIIPCCRCPEKVAGAVGVFPKTLDCAELGHYTAYSAISRPSEYYNKDIKIEFVDRKIV